MLRLDKRNSHQLPSELNTSKNTSAFMHTVINLQGDVKENKIILCDIEFTHALVYEYTSAMLIKRVIAPFT